MDEMKGDGFAYGPAVRCVICVLLTFACLTGLEASGQALDSLQYREARQAWLDGDIERVIRHARRAIRQDSAADVRWYELLGRAYQVREQHADAIPVLERAVQDTAKVSLLRVLAASYARQSRNESARELYRDILAADSTDRRARIELARLAADGFDWLEAQAHYETLVAADSTNGVWHARLARCLHQRGKQDMALEHMRTAHRLRPQDARISLTLSSWLRSANEPKAAAAAVKTTLDERPAHPKLWRRRADLAFEQNDLPAAREAYEQTLAYGDTSATVYRRLGLVANGEKRYADAIPPLTASIRLDSTSSRSHIHLGIAYRETEQPDRSARHLKTAINLLEGPITEAYVHLAQTEDERENLPEALREYRTAQRLQPGRTTLTFRIAQLYDRYYLDKTVAATYYRLFLNKHSSKTAGDDPSLLVPYARQRLNALQPIIHMQQGRRSQPASHSASENER